MVSFEAGKNLFLCPEGDEASRPNACDLAESFHIVVCFTAGSNTQHAGIYKAPIIDRELL